jgi:flagellar basal-body rod protein FlgB
MEILFDPTSRLLSQMIQATALRHRVLASNLANVETPEYQAQDVSFSVALDEAQGAPRVQAGVAPDPEAIPRRDGNSVNLDGQMVKLAQNTGWHMGMLQVLTNRMAMMRAAIRGS